jgi:hypothetical protein
MTSDTGLCPINAALARSVHTRQGGDPKAWYRQGGPWTLRDDPGTLEFRG